LTGAEMLFHSELSRVISASRTSYCRSLNPCRLSVQKTYWHGAYWLLKMFIFS